MALVKWDSSYSVNVNRCDEDHKKLFSLINTLHDAMLVGKGSEAIQKVAKELGDYTRFHFSGEESLLEKTKYPELTAHRAQHKDFVSRVEQLQQELKSGKSGNSISLLEFLKNWLSGHIKQTDKMYSAHLNANGVS